MYSGTGERREKKKNWKDEFHSTDSAKIASREKKGLGLQTRKQRRAKKLVRAKHKFLD